MFQNEGLAVFGLFVFCFMALIFILVLIFTCKCKRVVIEDAPSENNQNEGFLEIGNMADPDQAQDQNQAQNQI